MRRIWWLSRPVVTSAGALLVAAAVAVYAAAGVVSVEGVTAAASGDGAGLVVEPVVPLAAPESVRVLAAVDRDPFHPERRRPRERFRLPGERRTPPPRAPAPAALPSTMQLTGTMVYGGGGGIAMLSERGRSTRMVRVGESVGNLTLERVTADEAVFRSPNGATVVVRVTRPGG